MLSAVVDQAPEEEVVVLGKDERVQVCPKEKDEIKVEHLEGHSHVDMGVFGSFGLRQHREARKKKGSRQAEDLVVSAADPACCKDRNHSQLKTILETLSADRNKRCLQMCCEGARDLEVKDRLFRG